MNIHREIEEIWECIEKVRTLATQLAEKIGVEGVCWADPTIVTLDQEAIDRFKENDGETDDYFVDQWTGYCEDDYCGNLYFKTDTPNTFIMFSYHC